VSIGAIERSIEYGALVGIERAGLALRPTGSTEHDLEQTKKGGHPLSQRLLLVDRY
jgi:hypothetical protein